MTVRNAGRPINGRVRLGIFHDECARNAVPAIVPGPLPGGYVDGGRRTLEIRVSRIATAELLLATLSALAGELSGTDWPGFLRKMVWDTEYYFSADGLDGGRKTVREIMADNKDIYATAGIG